MTAREVQELPSGEKWIYEIKWDGYRALGIKHGSVVRLISRNHKNLGRDFPAVMAALSTIQADTVLLAGEVVALDGTGRPSFQRLQNRGASTANTVYYAFDLLFLNGEDWRGRPLKNAS